MPPPVTPSPHRFVIKKQQPAGKPQLVQSQPPASSNTQQFIATPRFNFSSTPRPTLSQNLPTSTPSATRYLTPARPQIKHEEIIDNSSDGLEDIRDSIKGEAQKEDTSYLFEDVEDDYRIEEPVPKRRRISSSSVADDDVVEKSTLPELHTSPPQILSSPPAIRQPVSSKASRFVVPTPAPQSTLQDSQTIFLKPPRFRPPETAERSPPQDPLPDQFSPHRRGHKYIPGGLAAEVRDWLMNVESTVSANAAQKKDDPWLVKFVIEEVSGSSRSGMTMVKGIQSGGKPILKVLLAGEGEGTGLQKGAKLEIGKIVGIKGPICRGNILQLMC
ncbi:hypothetical protein B0O99DRAFT_653680 [Bisporella sp. PMI_857]|nr:hypothetical protein B0O99DRAFT_653680 [Bisporella sp. PMI_857]